MHRDRARFWWARCALPPYKVRLLAMTTIESWGTLNMKPSSNFDIVVYGATGFTGQLVAEYLAHHYRSDPQLKWAMAGRSAEKLAAVRDAIGASADTPLIVADAADPASLNSMIEQTKLVIST